MATEVKHGPKPRFKARIVKHSLYGLRITGYYTKTDGLTAAGVSDYQFHSGRAEKQQAELLGMRTAFVMWFLEEWVRRGGEWDEGVQALRGYPFWKARYELLRIPSWRHVWGNIRNTVTLAWYVIRH